MLSSTRHIYVAWSWCRSSASNIAVLIMYPNSPLLVGTERCASQQTPSASFSLREDHLQLPRRCRELIYHTTFHTTPVLPLREANVTILSSASATPLPTQLKRPVIISRKGGNVDRIGRPYRTKRGHESSCSSPSPACCTSARGRNR